MSVEVSAHIKYMCIAHRFLTTSLQYSIFRIDIVKSLVVSVEIPYLFAKIVSGATMVNLLYPCGRHIGFYETRFYILYRDKLLSESS